MQTDKEYLYEREITALRCDSVGEYPLPDYNGDVKRILFVNTRVVPSGSFASDDSLGLSGSVQYEVVYVDAENTVTHAEFNTDYEAAIRINPDTYVDSDVSTSVASYNIRLVGPRKIAVKCALESDVHIREKKSYSVEGDTFMEYDPEVRRVCAQIMTPYFATSDSFDVNEEVLSIEGAIADEIEILTSTLRCELEKTDVSSDTAELRGRVKISLLYRDSDGSVKEAKKETLCSATVECEGIGECDYTDARMNLDAVKTTINATDDGVSLNVSATLSAHVFGRKNNELPLVEDVYAKERGCDNDYMEFGYTEHVSTQTFETDFSASQALDQLGIDGSCEVVFCDSTASVSLVECDGERVKVVGDVRVFGAAMLTDDEKSVNYVPIKFSLPFEKYVNNNCQNNGLTRYNCSIKTTDTALDIGDGKCSVSCRILGALDVCADKKQRCVSASYLNDQVFERDESVIVAYYPDDSETLFGIAKKFHTSVSEIASLNRLAEPVFSSSNSSLKGMGVGRLLIK